MRWTERLFGGGEPAPPPGIRPPADQQPVSADLFNKIVAVYESALESQKAIAARALEELAQSRAQHGEQISSLITQVMELKRDGLVLSQPSDVVVDRSADGPENSGDQIPDEVWEAIEERSENQTPVVKRSLIDYARKELRRGRRAGEEPSALVERVRTKILEGEDPE